MFFTIIVRTLYFRHEFKVSYQLDIYDICDDFRENLEGGWRIIFGKFLKTCKRKLAIVPEAHVG